MKNNHLDVTISAYRIDDPAAWVISAHCHDCGESKKHIASLQEVECGNIDVIVYWQDRMLRDLREFYCQATTATTEKNKE